MILPLNQIIHGDALVILRTLPSASVDCVITSPPYWGLRDYDVAGQLGLEPHFDQYVDRLCAIFNEAKRVLKPTGTCFINLNDTYSNKKRGKTDVVVSKPVDDSQQPFNDQPVIQKKSLCLIPQRVAMALLDQGWLLRNTIIWHKPNAMPASVRDRFTVDYEYLFFFTQQQRYYFAQQFEPIDMEKARYRAALRANKSYNLKAAYQQNYPIANPNPLGRNKRCVWSVNTGSYKGAHCAVYTEKLLETPILAGCPKGGIVLDPFMGAGTTALVARRLDRQFIGIELNANYIQLAQDRLAQSA